MMERADAELREKPIAPRPRVEYDVPPEKVANLPFTVKVAPEPLGAALSELGYPFSFIKNLRVKIRHQTTPGEALASKFLGAPIGGSYNIFSGVVSINVPGLAQKAADYKRQVDEIIGATPGKTKAKKFGQRFKDGLQTILFYYFFPDAKWLQRKTYFFCGSQKRKEWYIQAVKKGEIPSERGQEFLYSLVDRVVQRRILPEALAHEITHARGIRRSVLKAVIAAIPFSFAYAFLTYGFRYELAKSVSEAIFQHTKDPSLAKIGGRVIEELALLAPGVPTGALLRGKFMESQAYSAGKEREAQNLFLKAIEITPNPKYKTNGN